MVCIIHVGCLGAAVLTGTGQILSEALASQGDVHEQWGGVVPKLAQKAHQQAIDDTIDQALQKAGLYGAANALTAIAVTVGPGLGPCLQVGVRKAYELAAQHQCAYKQCNRVCVSYTRASNVTSRRL